MIWFSSYSINERIEYRTVPGKIQIGIALTPAELQKIATILLGDDVDGVSINRITVEVDEEDEE